MRKNLDESMPPREPPTAAALRLEAVSMPDSGRIWPSSSSHAFGQSPLCGTGILDSGAALGVLRTTLFAYQMYERTLNGQTSVYLASLERGRAAGRRDSVMSRICST